LGGGRSRVAIDGGNPAKLSEGSEILGIEFEPGDAGTAVFTLAGPAHAQGAG
jgi:hypothetical protein